MRLGAEGSLLLERTRAAANSACSVGVILDRRRKRARPARPAAAWPACQPVADGARDRRWSHYGRGCPTVSRARGPATPPS